MHSFQPAQYQMGGSQAPQGPFQDPDEFASTMPAFDDDFEAFRNSSIGNLQNPGHGQGTAEPVPPASPFNATDSFNDEDILARPERDEGFYNPDLESDEGSDDPEPSRFSYPEPSEPQNPAAYYHNTGNVGVGVPAATVNGDQEQHPATFDHAQSQYAGFYPDSQDRPAMYHDAESAGFGISANAELHEEEQDPAPFDDLQYHYAPQEHLAHDSGTSSTSELLEVDASSGLRDEDRFQSAEEGEAADRSAESVVEHGWDASLSDNSDGFQDLDIEIKPGFLGFDKSENVAGAAQRPSRAMTSGSTGSLLPLGSYSINCLEYETHDTERLGGSVLPDSGASSVAHPPAQKGRVSSQKHYPSPKEVTQQSRHNSPYHLRPSRPVNESYDDYVRYREQLKLSKQNSAKASQEKIAVSPRVMKQNGSRITSVEKGKKRKRTPVQEPEYVEHDGFYEEESELLEETCFGYDHHQYAHNNHRNFIDSPKYNVQRDPGYQQSHLTQNYHQDFIDRRTYNGGQYSEYRNTPQESRFSYPSPKMSNSASDSVYFGDQLQAKRRKTAGGHVQAPISYPSASNSNSSADTGLNLKAYTKRARRVQGDCEQTGFGGERKWWFCKTNRNGLEVRKNEEDQWQKAIRHDDIRAELLQAAGDSSQYAFARKRGQDHLDQTSYLPYQHYWGFNKKDEWRNVHDDILTRFEKQGYNPPNSLSQPQGVMMHNGRVVVDRDNRPVIDWPLLPATLSAHLEGGFMEACRRLCPKMGTRDFWARMPQHLKQPSVDGKQGKDALNNSGLNMRCTRFREAYNLIAWSSRKGSTALKDKVLALMSNDDIRNNTTENI